MTKPHFDIEYETGATAPYVDWVAGGNFDGYIHKKSIRFIESGNQVIVKSIILDKSRFDGDANNSEIFGEFEYTGKDTITIKYGEIEMRGKILGDKKEYIVFDLFSPLMDINFNEVYQLK
jgi:hypothetical protein